MKRITKACIIAGTAAAVIISGTLVSYASWVLPGPTATVKTRAGTMPRGVTPSAAIQSGKAVVSWSAQEIVPGRKMTSYIVSGYDTDQPPHPPVLHTVAASGSDTESTVFTATELAGGKWKWAITPKFTSWTGAEGKLSNPKLVFPAAGPTTALVADGTAATTSDKAPAGAPTATRIESTPPPSAAVELLTTAPKDEPTTPAPEKTEKTVEPEKTEAPEADPTPSDTPSESDLPPAS